MLQGRNSDTPPIPIQIPLSSDEYWSVDRSCHEKLGIWVLSSRGAWYWLKQCHASQEEVHQPIRAKFGLLVNIIDVLIEEHNGQESYHAEQHLKLTPQELHERLSCMDTALFEEYKKDSECDFFIFQEPFDYTLLSEQGGAAFCKQHLEGLALEGFNESKFFKGLKSNRPNKKWKSFEYRASAELAEERSQRTSWGELLSNAEPIRPNWNMEAKLDQDGRLAGKNKKRRNSNGGDTKKPKKKQTTAKRNVLEDSDEDDYEPPAKKKKKTTRQKRVADDNGAFEDATAAAAGQMKQESYSDERMVSALVSL